MKFIIHTCVYKYAGTIEIDIRAYDESAEGIHLPKLKMLNQNTDPKSPSCNDGSLLLQNSNNDYCGKCQLLNANSLCQD